MRNSLARLLLALSFVLQVSQIATAKTAKGFVISQGSTDINAKKDHYEISIADGWISSKDSTLKALLSRRAKLVLAIKGTMTLSNGEVIEMTRFFDVPGISRDLDDPLGITPVIFDNIPGDARVNLSFRMIVPREDRMTDILKAAEDSKAALPADMFAAPWLGYAKLANSIISNVFGTTASSYPFFWDGQVQMPVGTVKEHFIALVAPMKDREAEDSFVQDLVSTKLKYENGKLTYDNENLEQRTYVVLQVRKDDGYDMHSYPGTSKAPWATLASSQFTPAVTFDANGEEQLKALAGNFLKQLQNLEQLLRDEPRFSAYDRLNALNFYASRAKDLISSRCGQLNPVLTETGGKCPTVAIQLFADQHPVTDAQQPVVAPTPRQ